MLSETPNVIPSELALETGKRNIDWGRERADTGDRVGDGEEICLVCCSGPGMGNLVGRLIGRESAGADFRGCGEADLGIAFELGCVNDGGSPVAVGLLVCPLVFASTFEPDPE